LHELVAFGGGQRGEQLVVEVVHDLVETAQVAAALGGDRDDVAAAVVGIWCFGGGTLDRAELIHRVSGATKVSQASAAERITELTAAGFLHERGDGRVQVTDEAQARWAEVRAAIEPINQRLWGDLPAEDLATAGRVLSIVLDRATAVLVSL